MVKFACRIARTSLCRGVFADTGEPPDAELLGAESQIVVRFKLGISHYAAPGLIVFASTYE